MNGDKIIEKGSLQNGVYLLIIETNNCLKNGINFRIKSV